MHTLNLDALLKSIINLLQLAIDILSETPANEVKLLQVALNLIQLVEQSDDLLKLKHIIILKTSTDIIQSVLPAFNDNQEIRIILQQIIASVQIITELQK